MTYPFLRYSRAKTSIMLVLIQLACPASAQNSAANIRPVGSVCLAGQACVGATAEAIAKSASAEEFKETMLSEAESKSEIIVEASTGAIAESAPIEELTDAMSAKEFEVTMLNQGTDGAMVFEPSVLKIAVGDTVTFKPTNPGHNSASIAGMIPPGASSWDGGMSQEVKITFTEEGTYVYQCTPHLMMAMVGVIAVGDASVNLSAVKAAASDKKSEFMMSAQRLDEYLEEI